MFKLQLQGLVISNQNQYNLIAVKRKHLNKLL